MGYTKKVHPLLVKAVEEIRTKIAAPEPKGMGANIPFTEGSRVLAAKYFEGKLLDIEFKRLKTTWKKEGKLKRFKKRRCV